MENKPENNKKEETSPRLIALYVVLGILLIIVLWVLMEHPMVIAIFLMIVYEAVRFLFGRRR
jgi:predicted RND superfamily exporter protein